MGYYGCVEYEPPSNTSRPVLGKPERCRWTPPAALELPGTFSVGLFQRQDLNGRRYFEPRNVESFIKDAAAAGSQILMHQGIVDKHQAWSYRCMLLVFQMWRRCQERLKHDRLSARDLCVTRSGRGGAIEREIVPAELQADGWNVDRIIRHGRDATHNQRMNRDAALLEGLITLARERPLPLPTAEVSPVIRMALFDVSEFEGIDAAAQEEIRSRFLDLLQAHLDDDAEDFFGWAFSSRSNLPKAIANRRPQFPRDQAKRALLDLAWEAYQYVAGCHQAFARWCLHCLDLDQWERQIFEHAFCPQPYLGELSSALLFERSCTHRLLSEIRLAPDDKNLIAALHRLLSWFGEIAPQRRLADRQIKSQGGRKALQMTGMHFDNVSHGRSNDGFDAIADSLAERHDMDCVCDRWKCRITEPQVDQNGRLEIELICGCGMTSRSLVLSLEDLRLMAENAVSR